MTEFLIAESSVYAGTGLFDDPEIFLRLQYAGMQGPLGTAPGFASMDGTAVVIKYAVSIYGLHLYSIPCLTPIVPGNFFPTHAKMFNHSFLVVFIKGNRGFTLAAVAALLTDEYV